MRKYKTGPLHVVAHTISFAAHLLLYTQTNRINDCTTYICWVYPGALICKELECHTIRKYVWKFYNGIHIICQVVHMSVYCCVPYLSIYLVCAYRHGKDCRPGTFRIFFVLLFCLCILCTLFGFKVDESVVTCCDLILISSWASILCASTQEIASSPALPICIYVPTLVVSWVGTWGFLGKSLEDEMSSWMMTPQLSAVQGFFLLPITGFLCLDNLLLCLANVGCWDQLAVALVNWQLLYSTSLPHDIDDTSFSFLLCRSLWPKVIFRPPASCFRVPIMVSHLPSWFGRCL